MVTEQEVAAALYDLGPTPTHVHEHLKKAGVTGFRRIPSACPVAKYLQSKFKDIEFVEIGATRCYVDGKTAQGGKASMCMDVPAVVGAFIHEFDDGCYPDLDIDSTILALD